MVPAAQRNLVVAQSGGPSPVINNSLRAVVEMAREFNSLGTVYGAWHGIEGVLKEELLDLSAQPRDEIALLRTTPAAGSIGTCRYKLRSQQTDDFRRILDVFAVHNVGYFLYIGGNDSMDTADKIARLAAENGLELIAVGVPKTIDNDVGDSSFQLIDHTPGYGSVAKYWMHMVQNANEENAGSSPSDPVLVLQAMGRKIGFIPAAARLADPDREMPLEIALAESGLTVEQLADNVQARLRERGRCLVVVSEGFGAGEIGERRDSFGHAMYSSSQATVAQLVVNYFNARGIAARGAARGNVPGTDQRHAMILASTVDLDEAYRVGQKAVELAAEQKGGRMATIRRDAGRIYSVRYDCVALEQVANSERTFPKQWITPDGRDVTDDFICYARPLIGEDNVSIPMVGGRQRLARLTPIFADRKLPPYEPQALRT